MSADPNRAVTGDAGPGVERLLALSDGVVAIAITLLVLQLNVPDPTKLTNPTSASELAAQLRKDADQLISYVISFYVIAQFWLVHHRVFRRITRQREGLAWWNFAFLFTVSVMPFTSDLQGKFAANPLAVDIFAMNLLAAACRRTQDRRSLVQSSTRLNGGYSVQQEAMSTARIPCMAGTPHSIDQELPPP
jgi:uncharacterized membrane protein